MNDAIIWISTYGMNHDAYVSQSTEYLIRTNVGKLIATAVVMVWNFLTRKMVARRYAYQRHEPFAQG